MVTRRRLGRRWVVKLGSSLVTREGRGVDYQALDRWTDQMARLRAGGAELVLVSSGAVAEGMARLGWTTRPAAMNQLQAAAAIGQMGLVQAYEQRFKRHGIMTAQVLLTHEDLADRQRYLNARSTLNSLLELGSVPVINENDTVATDEIRFGDNDTLAALVANLLVADQLVILTDQAGLYEADPRHDPTARLLPEVEAGDPRLEPIAQPTGGRLGRGGMLSKVRAAQRAARSGAATLVAAGGEPDVLTRLADGESLGTRFQPAQRPLDARKQWLASQLHVRGVLRVDPGAAERLRRHGSSLLAVGVVAVDGDFRRGEIVACYAPDGTEIARGLVNYGAAEAAILAGQPSRQIEALLGYANEPELIHRDNMVLMREEPRDATVG